MSSDALSIERVGEDAVEVMPMKIRDLRAVMTVENQSPTSSWSKSMFLSELGGPNRCYLVVKLDGSVVGFAGLIAIAGEGHIANIGVDSAVRRLGLGSHLMLGLASGSIDLDCHSLTLEVGVKNHQAQALYTKFGFAPTGIRKNYYSKTNEDALIMWASDVDGEQYQQRMQDIAVTLRKSEPAK